jgi:hypothetical protein
MLACVNPLRTLAKYLAVSCQATFCIRDRFLAEKYFFQVLDGSKDQNLSSDTIWSDE